MQLITTSTNLKDVLDTQANHIDCIFIDFDGVVINSEPMQYKAYAIVLAEYGVELTQEFFIEKCLGKPSLVNVTFLIKNFNLSMTTDQLVEMHSKQAVELILGLEINWFIQPLLDWSKSKGITPNIISAGMESNITKILSAKNMRDKFGDIYSMHGRPESMTKQDVILELTNGDASKSLIVEDSESTLKLLSEINMFRIGVYHEFNKHFDLQADIFVETKDS